MHLLLLISTETRYAHLPECIQVVYTASDSVKVNFGAVEEIDWLKENQSYCSNNSPITRRISLRLMELGDNHYGTDGSEIKIDKKALFNESVEWARLAIEQDEYDDLNYENLSMAYAAVVSVSRLRSQARLADSVRVYAEKAVELNPDNHRAYHILGRWHYEVSKLGWFVKRLSKLIFRASPDGSFELAEEYFNKAIALNNIPVHHYWLGMAYLESGKKDMALERFEMLLNLEEGQYNDEFFKEQARKLIAKHG